MQAGPGNDLHIQEDLDSTIPFVFYARQHAELEKAQHRIAQLELDLAAMDRALTAKERRYDDLRRQHLPMLADHGSDGDSMDDGSQDGDETAATEAAVDWAI